jgi:hypothetical protein
MHPACNFLGKIALHYFTRVLHVLHVVCYCGSRLSNARCPHRAAAAEEEEAKKPRQHKEAEATRARMTGLAFIACFMK